jgi:hypothetical protein
VLTTKTRTRVARSAAAGADGRAAATKRARVESPTRAAASQVRAALEIVKPDHPSEVEAETTAKHVVSMSEPAHPAALPPARGGPRASAALEDRKEQQEPIQRAAVDDKKDEPVQRTAEGQPNGSANVSGEIKSSLSGGEPLPASVRGFMEPRFGADFSSVRMHADSRAARLNKDVSARAFAYGNHIFFGNNQFQPHTGEGRELIAHELTHVVQQRGAPITGEMRVSDPGDALEREAERAARGI